MIIETIKQVVISNGVGKTGKPWTRYSFDCESEKNILHLILRLAISSKLETMFRLKENKMVGSLI